MRRASEPRAPGLFAPAALFALGLAASVATCAEHHDAQHPMPLSPNRDWRWLSPAVAAALPPARRCEPGAIEGPAVEADANGWVVDDVSLRDEAELTNVLAAKRALWAQVQPNRPFPGVVAMALPAAMPIERANRALAAARAAGYRTIDVVEALPAERWPSRTLGAIALWVKGCRIRMTEGKEPPGVRTWGELASALASHAAP